MKQSRAGPPLFRSNFFQKESTIFLNKKIRPFCMNTLRRRVAKGQLGRYCMDLRRVQDSNPPRFSLLLLLFILNLFDLDPAGGRVVEEQGGGQAGGAEESQGEGDADDARGQVRLTL